MVNKSCVVKLLNRMGIFCIIGALFLCLLSKRNEIYLDFCGILLFIGILLTIPDYWFFFIHQRQDNKKMADYWFVNFLALPLIVVLLIVYFIIRLS
jgi:hypothetical protein